LDIKEKIKALPDFPGVYIFKDKTGNIIYIGKACSVKKRVKSHFSSSSGEKSMLRDNVSEIDFTLTSNEATALLLESALIKRYCPKFNVLLKDDKSYPRLKLTVNEEYPRLMLVRKVMPDGALYFGPYTDSSLLREAVKSLRRVFPLRTCRVIPGPSQKKPCLDMHIGQCPGPCVNEKKSDYLNTVEELRLFLEGRQDDIINSLSNKMKAVSDNKEYEKAAEIRDRIAALSSLSASGNEEKELSDNARLRHEQNQAKEGMEELRVLLAFTRVPDAIEAFDVSNISGKEATGSMVCFKSGMPYKHAYMHFKIKTVNVIDDYSMMREIVSRRYKKLIKDKGRFPDLIIIDGGKGHLSAAKNQLRALRIINIPVISIAKNPDKLYIHEKKEPILLGRFSKALYLCQRMRDEAHRFAITYHRYLRSKRTRFSELDNIQGIGPKRKLRLIRHFGSLEGIKSADMVRLKQVDFINEKEAKAIYSHFRL